MTGTLKDAIADLVARHSAIPRSDIVPAIKRALARLPDASGDAPRDKNYDAISDGLGAMLAQGKSISPRQARDGAWCLWTTRTAIAAKPQTLEPFLSQLRAMRHKGASRALALSYLVSFHQDRPGLDAVAATLRDLVSVAGAPFDTLHKHLLIFHPVEGPRRIGDAAIEKRTSPRHVLEQQGMQMELVLAGGLVEPCTRRVLERAAADMRLPPGDRIDFIRMIAVKDGTNTLSFPQHKPLVANALLLPYADDRIQKPERDRILNFLIAIEGLGDPRTKPGNWVGMSDAAKIAVRWLTEQSLRQFLDVVESVNPNENWPYRRIFWEAVHAALEPGPDNQFQAWVVLDNAGTAVARRQFGKNSPFAQFSGGGVQQGHAVLLMRIGKGVCAEWSFSGKCRFWVDAERPGAPRLYEQTYDAEFLKLGRRYAPILEITHYPHTGISAWQHQAARQIEKMTGVRLSPKDYML